MSSCSSVSRGQKKETKTNKEESLKCNRCGVKLSDSDPLCYF